MASKKTKTAGTSLIAIVVAALLFVAQQLGWINLNDDPKTAPGPRETTTSPTKQRASLPDPDERRGSPAETAAPTDRHFITKLQQRGATDEPVIASGVIVKVLPDDNEGSRHQRFLVELSDGHVVKISHNIDLAPRIPNPREGDELTFKGDFEANELGGAVHWTHRDPRNRHEHGYLEHDGVRYE